MPFSVLNNTRRARLKSYIRYNTDSPRPTADIGHLPTCVTPNGGHFQSRFSIRQGRATVGASPHIPHSYMVSKNAKEVFIQGITPDGKVFRPSDWAERLAGVMCSFRPGGAQPGDHLSYSPWCVPIIMNGVRCVIVQAELRDAEPMAWDFVMNFGRDNNLVITEACSLPDAPAGK
jgi:hypothetical protein